MTAQTLGYKSILGKRLGLIPGGLEIDGIPFFPGGNQGNGNVFFCDPANGNDNSDGTAPSRAVASLQTAHDLTTAGNNDIVFLIGDGSTSATARLTTTLTWSNNATHLIGITAPTRIAQRARISHASTAPTTAFDMVTVTGDG